uniref:Uncharacterized protein LOC114331063 n=1 Tax=Diabrotica virgifera virgifera TaxID=50390 RepID=A0A6P7FUC1_DIAVI
MSAQSVTNEWFCVNRLLLNAAKTNRVVFSLRDTQNVNDGMSSVRFLGVLLDPKLQWGEHINSKKLAKNLFVLRNLASNVSHKVLITAYHAIFQSHLAYAILVWGHSAEMLTVFGWQRKAVRVLAGLWYRDDCRQAYRSLRILTVPSLYILENLMFIKRGGAHFETHENIHQHDTRYKHHLVPAYWRLRRCQTGPGYWAIKFFNKLPDSLKCLQLNQFKSTIKDILLENVFYSNEEFLAFKF